MHRRILYSSGPLKKLRGCIAASPIIRFSLSEAAYLFFLAFAFFFAGISFSSQEIQKYPPAKLAERVFIIMYSDCASSCQEESE
ncbi:MAG: hypothetical protein ACRD2G_16395 [Terriglobia bacterium]